MRWILVASLVCLLLAPTASASPGATVTLVGPESATANATATMITANLTLTLEAFHCMKDEAYAVTLTLNATGVNASLDASTKVFLVPAGSYAFKTWSGSAPVNVTLADASAGSFTVDAKFDSNGGDCIVPGGFPTANATWTVNVTGPASETPTPTTPTTPTTPPTPTPTPTPTQPSPTSTTPTTTGSAGNTTNGTMTSSGNATMTTTTPTGPVDRLPPSSGYIGDYKPQESAKTVPAAGSVLVLAAAAAAFVLLRKR